jgi:hypothetical protein
LIEKFVSDGYHVATSPHVANIRRRPANASSAVAHGALQNECGPCSSTNEAKQTTRSELCVWN